jgi:hypothetical protein
MSTHALPRTAREPVALHKQWLWLAGGLLYAFAVPFVFADLLEVPRDLYYAIYFAAVAGLLYAWLHATRQSARRLLLRHWPLAIALGVAFGALLSFMVVGTEDATSRPNGLELAAAVLWRGVFYGLADGLLLSAFPILVVFAAFEGSRGLQTWPGRIGIGLVALLASLAITASYHAGYSDFRSAKVRRPLAGDVVWSMPTLLTLNPIGAPIAHAGLHTTAVLRSYETGVYLPPHEASSHKPGER